LIFFTIKLRGLNRTLNKDNREESEMQPHERIYVALDTDDVDFARRLVDQLTGKVGGFKIGLEFITSMFARFVARDPRNGILLLKNLQSLFKAIGEDLFWDGKFSDIPNTVAGASFGLGPLSPKFFNVHANSGREAMIHAVANKGRSRVLAVTLLTSFDGPSCLLNFGAEPSTVVSNWANYAADAGVDGLICSPKDLEWINRNTRLQAMDKMTPGIRPAWSVKGDQARVMTPAKALQAGVTWMVIGRPITQADNPLEAVQRITDEIAAAEA
jgi:orotidine-5'-phosphate decarboxylase